MPTTHSNHETQPRIEVHDLKKSFGTFEAVKGLTFSVQKGEIFAFLGPNGAGKTTTIKMQTTLVHPTSGVIRINGFDPVHQQLETRRSFGIVFQDPSLDDELTAFENMEIHGVLYEIPKKLRRDRMQELLTLVELWDRKDSIVRTFSGGMKRRLEIARSLLHHPKILFLDEPTQGLDPQTRTSIWNYIQSLNKKEQITVFFTTHYMDEAERVAQKVAIIDHGKLLIQDTPEALKKQTNTNTIEEAFLSLTGKQIRADEAGSIDALRIQKKMWGR